MVVVQVVAAFQNENKAFTEVRLGAAPPSTILDDFKAMYTNMPFQVPICSSLLCRGDECFLVSSFVVLITLHQDCKFNIDGQGIECHKAILAAGSEKFVPMFKDIPPSGIELRNISNAAFHTMLRWLYYGDDSVEPLPACELGEKSRCLPECSAPD